MNNALAGEILDWVLAQHDDRTVSVTLLGSEWEVMPGIWPPDPVTAKFTAALPLAPGVRFLELGAAAGVTSVVAAQRGCERVVATDIAPAAAENTRRNAARHGVADKVQALTSDLFAELQPSDEFDVICMNPPMMRAEESRELRELEVGALDPGFSLHRRLFDEARPHLAAGGRIYINCSATLGEPAELVEQAQAAGYTAHEYDDYSIMIPAGFMGSPPAAVAAADEHGILRIAYTLFEFAPRE